MQQSDLTRRYPELVEDEDRLGALAMRFRSTRDLAKRDEIARDYRDTVMRLIKSGRWQEGPAPEDQLPDDHMPEEFFEFWSCPTCEP